MKLIVNNPHGIVTSAFFKEAELSFSLYINTKERKRYPDCYGSNCHGGKSNSFELTYFKNPDDNSIDSDEVILIAESEKDEMFLSCLHFELMSKDQLWIIFLPSEVYEKKVHGK
jgi:hypothetical protein